MGLVLVSEIERRHRMIKENFYSPARVGDVYRAEFGEPEYVGRLFTVVEISAFNMGITRQVTLLQDDGSLTHMLEHTFYGIFSRVTGGEHGVDEKPAKRPGEELTGRVGGAAPDDGES